MADRDVHVSFRDNLGSADALIVLMPCRSLPRDETVSALVHALDGFSATVLTTHGLPVVKARNALAARAIEYAKTDPDGLNPREWFVLWIDDDAWWKSGSVSAAVEALRNYPALDVVAATFGGRTRLSPIAAFRRWRSCNHTYAIPAFGLWNFCDSQVRPRTFFSRHANCDDADILPVERIGFHWVAMPLDTLERVGKNPFTPPVACASTCTADFISRYRFPRMRGTSEDFAFCDRVVDAGGQIAVALSIKVIHVDKDGLGYYPLHEALPQYLWDTVLPEPYCGELKVDSRLSVPARSPKHLWCVGTDARCGDVISDTVAHVSRDAALVLARSTRAATVYEIEPIGRLKSLGQGSYQLPKARILDVVPTECKITHVIDLAACTTVGFNYPKETFMDSAGHDWLSKTIFAQ